MDGQLQNDPENTAMEYTHIPVFHNTGMHNYCMAVYAHLKLLNFNYLAYDYIPSIPTFHNTGMHSS